MKYYWSFFLWENGAKSEEYTDKLVAPIFYEEKLNEELDTAEVVLDKMDIATRSKFPPKTKFRLELRIDKDSETPYKKWDFIVDHDDVEQYTGEQNLCCHRLFLIEPSAIAQGMHVDNIALTYELQDVTLNYKTIRNPDDIIKIKSVPGGGDKKIYEYFNQRYIDKTGEYNRTTSYKYEWSDLESLNALLVEIDGSIPKTINFNLPKLKCFHLNGENKTELFEVPTLCEIYKLDVNNGVPDENSKELVHIHTFNPTTASSRNDNIMYNSNNLVGIRNYDDEKYTYFEPSYGSGSIELFKNSTYTQFPAIINLSDTSHSNRSVSFVTDTLSIEEMNANKSIRYQIRISANPYQSNSLITYFNKQATISDEYSTTEDWVMYVLTVMFGGSLQKRRDVNVYTNGLGTSQPNDIYIETVFNCVDLTSDAPPSPFIMKGEKYSCLDLFRKAMLTCDTQILDNERVGLDQLDGIKYPIVVDEDWIDRMRLAKCYETIFEEKNLWEILLQIGYYLHAIPYLEFSEDGDDYFVLKFKQLGGTNNKEDESQKITIFNNCNLSEYFSQLDSYVENLFSPQNLIEEWLVPKTSDDSYLISNNTAELQLQYPISELVEFDITYDSSKNENMGVSGTKSALDRVFEKSVYSILNNQYSRNAAQRVKPSKGTSLYYEMGNNKILGLNYSPPTSTGEGFMALKDILTDLFQGQDEHWDADKIKFNSLIFRVKYRTQDSLRLTQMRPDLNKYVKNSIYEKYPHHEQFFGQQDKIVDSERFSANLWGRLVRTGNELCQCQESVKDITKIKECGDLLNFSQGPFYITSIDNEFYADEIFQKVTYSKNFNQISQIVTIPSEPRFYEVSEKSTIRREVRLREFFILTTRQENKITYPRYVNRNKWRGFLKHLLINQNFENLPNFAFTRFKADKLRDHTDTSGQVIAENKLFPSCEVKRNNDNTIEPKESSNHADVVVPLLHFPMKNSIIFEWDMADNFKAGDSVDTSISGGNTNDEAYYAKQSVRYCDILGRADLFSFKLFNKNDWDYSELQQLPKAVNIPDDNDCLFYLPDSLAIGLDKDNREAISFNFQIYLLTGLDDGDVEDFITFPNLFGEKTSPLKMCFLNKTVSMFDESVSLSTNMLKDDVSYEVLDTDVGIKISITIPSDVDLDKVKSIVLYDEENKIKYAYLAKNVSKLSNADKFKDWYIYPVYND